MMLVLLSDEMVWILSLSTFTIFNGTCALIYPRMCASSHTGVRVTLNSTPDWTAPSCSDIINDCGCWWEHITKVIKGS